MGFQSEAKLASTNITTLYQEHRAFKDLISPKFAPLEQDVSVINGVLQLDAQNFNDKVLPLSCVRACVRACDGALVFSSLAVHVRPLTSSRNPHLFCIPQQTRPNRFTPDTDPPHYQTSAEYNLTSPLFTLWDQRLDSLETDSGNLEASVHVFVFERFCLPMSPLFEL